jgi:hypothetical protein
LKAAGRFAHAAGSQFFFFSVEYRSQIGFFAGMIFRCGTQMSMFIMVLVLNVLTQLSHVGGAGWSFSGFAGLLITTVISCDSAVQDMPFLKTACCKISFQQRLGKRGKQEMNIGKTPYIAVPLP